MIVYFATQHRWVSRPGTSIRSSPDEVLPGLPFENQWANINVIFVFFWLAECYKKRLRVFRYPNGDSDGILFEYNKVDFVNLIKS